MFLGDVSDGDDEDELTAAGVYNGARSLWYHAIVLEVFGEVFRPMTVDSRSRRLALRCAYATVEVMIDLIL